MMTRDEHSIVLPAPTAWPFVTAFGLALLVPRLVTRVVVGIAGLIFLARVAIGWVQNGFPVEQHESVPVPAEPAPFVQMSRRSVEHLTAGANDHRVHIPAEIHPYSAGLRGGVVGAVAMAIVAVT